MRRRRRSKDGTNVADEMVWRLKKNQTRQQKQQCIVSFSLVLFDHNYLSKCTVS
jgi:hypothetical protein